MADHLARPAGSPTPTTDGRLALLALPDLAAALVDDLGDDLGGGAAAVLWQTSADDPGSRGCHPPGVGSDAAWQRVAEAADGFAPRDGRATLELASPALRGLGVRAALLLDGLPADVDAGALERRLARWRPFLDSALDKARLQHALARLRRSEQVQRALYAISDLASADLELDEMLRRLHAVVGELMYAENFYIVLHEPARDVLRILYFVDSHEEEWQASGSGEESMESLRHSLTWHLVRGGRPLRGPTDRMHEQVDGPIEVIGPPSADWLGVPMLDGGQVRGAMVVQHYAESGCYSAEDEALLAFVGSHILTALDRHQAREELEREVERRTHALQIEVHERERGERLQSALYRITELSQSAVDAQAFYAAVHAIVGEFIDARNFYIAVLDRDGHTLRFPYYVDRNAPEPPAPRELGRRITDYVIRHGRPLLADCTTDAGRAAVEALHRSGELVGDAGTSQCWLGVPLMCNERCVGVLAVQTYEPGIRYSARDQELLTFIAHQIGHGLERQRAAESLRAAYAQLERRVADRTRQLSEQIRQREHIEQQLKHEVLHDSLTGLPNRAYLREHLGRALARQRREPDARFAILFLDLDRFKLINDSAGHLVGDALLVEVARRFTACVRGPDVVARLGGDEFAVLLEDVHHDEDPARLAARMIASLHEPVRVDGRDLFTGTSIGVVLSRPHYRSADELLRDADIAMYRAKSNGRGQFEVFDEDLHQHTLELLQLENDLRQALARDEFAPYFQPILGLQDQAVAGYEALLRWNHPERGWLAPGDFLHAAEAGGLLEAIDWRMYHHTCRAIPALLGPGQYVNLNVSPKHLVSDDFDARLLALLDEHGVAPSQVRIEVTEGALMDDPEHAGATLERLHAAGVLAALDDFGTGYSSLGYLHRFRLSTVKIDRAFVEGLMAGSDTRSASAVAAAILTLASALGLEVVAEGIEDESQRQALLGLGCRLGQGFLFARPQALEQVLAGRR